MTEYEKLKFASEELMALYEKEHKKKEEWNSNGNENEYSDEEDI